MTRATLLFVIIGLLLLDQATKHLVLMQLETFERIRVTSFFNLVLVWNRGVSFGMFSGAPAWGSSVLTVVTSSIIVGIVVWISRERRALPRLALALVLAGAIGNLIDRLRFGAVVDFLDLHVGGYHWPAFNVADSAIVTGAVVLMIDGLLFARERVDDVEEKG